MIKRRRRLKQQTSLQDRLTAWAEEARDQARQLRPGPERDGLLKRARLAETTSHLNDWMNSPGLKSPT